MNSTGNEVVFAREPRLKRIHDLAFAADGSLYFTQIDAVHGIDRRGNVSTVASKVSVPGCPKNTPTSMQEPYLRGIVVRSDGAIYAAATNCRAVVKITRNGKIRTLRQERENWWPVGVAIHVGAVYALEADDPLDEDGSGVRVVKIAANGWATVIAQIRAPEGQ